MGNISSNSSSLYLHHQIREEIKKIVYDYKFWTDNKLCNKIELIYRDKLIKFPKTNLLNISATVGLKYSTNVSKKKLCHNIINHYQQRINLLKRIQHAIFMTQKKLRRAKDGPVCKNINKYIEDFFVCDKYKGLWVSQKEYNIMIKRVHKLKLYDQWKKYIDSLDKYYFKSLRQLQMIITKIKNDIDNSMEKVEFDKLVSLTNSTIKNMKNITDSYYILAINSI